jgi:hypothetical protein
MEEVNGEVVPPCGKKRVYSISDSLTRRKIEPVRMSRTGNQSHMESDGYSAMRPYDTYGGRTRNAMPSSSALKSEWV